MKNQRRPYHVGAHAGEDVDLRGLVALLRVALQVRREVWSGETTESGPGREVSSMAPCHQGGGRVRGNVCGGARVRLKRGCMPLSASEGKWDGRSRRTVAIRIWAWSRCSSLDLVELLLSEPAGHELWAWFDLYRCHLFKAPKGRGEGVPAVVCFWWSQKSENVSRLLNRPR